MIHAFLGAFALLAQSPSGGQESVIPAPQVASTTPGRGGPVSLASYISDDDYPDEARRRHEQGTVVVRLIIGPNGRVTDCAITQSSGSSSLDSTTCRLVQQRARFIPGRDRDGNPIAASLDAMVRWVIG